MMHYKRKKWFFYCAPTGSITLYHINSSKKVGETETGDIYEHWIEVVDDEGNDKLDKAAEIAEKRLGMSALDLHGAKHQAKFMPEGMRKVWY